MVAELGYSFGRFFAWLLVSELPDSLRSNATPRCCLRHNDLVRSDGSDAKRKEKQTIG